MVADSISTETKKNGIHIWEEQGKRVAAMDLGTNSNRLLIADADGTPVYREVRHVALGEGLADSGCLNSQAMERAILSFMDFAEMMNVYDVARYRAIATAACRMSSNSGEFLGEVLRTSGIVVDVIDEYEEARLTLLGARLNAPKDKKYLLVYDLGGGSTEVTLATNTSAPEILATVSVPLGARNATEMFKLEEYDAGGVCRLEQAVQEYLKPFLKATEHFDYHNHSALVATSSTPLRLASFYLKAPKYDKFQSDGVSMPVAALEKIITNIMDLSYEKRAESPYIGPQRAKIFVSALVIFRTIYRALGETEMIASLKSAQEAIIECEIQ